MGLRPETIERFWSKVEKTDGCWLWQGGTTLGYGRFCLSKTDIRRAHRFAYELIVRKLKQGEVLHHTCREPLCVNPSHLEAMTQSQHMTNHTKYTPEEKRAKAREQSYKWRRENKERWSEIAKKANAKWYQRRKDVA